MYTQPSKDCFLSVRSSCLFLCIPCNSGCTQNLSRPSTSLAHGDFLHLSTVPSLHVCLCTAPPAPSGETKFLLSANYFQKKKKKNTFRKSLSSVYLVDRTLIMSEIFLFIRCLSPVQNLWFLRLNMDFYSINNMMFFL